MDAAPLRLHGILPGDIMPGDIIRSVVGILDNPLDPVGSAGRTATPALGALGIDPASTLRCEQRTKITL